MAAERLARLAAALGGVRFGGESADFDGIGAGDLVLLVDGRDEEVTREDLGEFGLVPAPAAAAGGEIAPPRAKPTTVRIGDVVVNVVPAEIPEYVPRNVPEIYTNSQVRAGSEEGGVEGEGRGRWQKEREGPTHIARVPCTWRGSHAHGEGPMHMERVPRTWRGTVPGEEGTGMASRLS